MANYRPKSLDELNNLYGRSINAQQEIAKKTTVLEEKSQPEKTGFAPAAVRPEIKTREQTADEQITGYVNDFIKSFGTPAKPDRSAAATVTASMKTVPVGKPAQPKKENEAVKAAAEAHTDDKPRLIRNSERNSLFENYKKVMDDEDDYDFSEPDKGKRKPKKLFEKKSAKPAEEGKAEETAEEKKTEPEKTEEPKAEASVKTEAPEVKKEESVKEPAVKEKKAEAIEETEVEAKEEAEEEKAEKKKEKKAKKEKAPKQKKEKAPKEKKQKAQKESHGTVSRALVMLLIFCVLLCATAVGGVKAFSGINADVPVLGKYLLYTADRDYTRLGIAGGDLVVVEYKGIDYDDIFAYKKSGDEYAFARLTTVLNDESVIADDGDLRCLVFNNTVRGVVYKVIPAVGSIAAIIMSDFILVLGALLVLALILMLVAVFGCKPKKKKEKKAKQKKEKPEKVKKEKKSRKDKKAEKQESEEDEKLQDGQNEEDEGYADMPDFDAIEADFSFLLQEDADEPDGEEEAVEPVQDEAYTEDDSEAEEEADVEADDEDAPFEEAPFEDELPLEAEAPEEAQQVTEDIREIYSRYNISDYADEADEGQTPSDDGGMFYEKKAEDDPYAKYRISDYSDEE